MAAEVVAQISWRSRPSLEIAGKIVAKNMDSQANVDLVKEAIEKLDSKALG